MPDDNMRHPVVFERIGKSFIGPKGTVHALKGIDLAIPAGSIFGIIGRSGAGKSTLIRLVNRLEHASEGRVLVHGQDVGRLDERTLNALRRRTGMIFQHFNLLSSRSVYGNIALPLRAAGVPRQRIEARVGEVLDLVGLAEKRDAFVAELSGGQKQRVGIARALVHEPDILLCDEATSALDPETTQSILALLSDINRRLGLTVLLITHEMAVIREICDRVAVLHAGELVEEGEVWRVFGAPAHPATRSLLSPLVHGLPAELAGRLAQEAPDGPHVTILVLRVTGEEGRDLSFSALGDIFGADARLLHGGVDRIQDRAQGQMILAASLAPGERETALLRARALTRMWRCSAMSLTERSLRALLDTLTMVGVSCLIVFVVGLTLGVTLVVTAPSGIYARPRFNHALGLVVNAVRSLPFIILLIVLLPVTRFIVGTTIGVWGAVVPLSVSLIPFFARISEVALREVDRGLVEAAHAMGCRRPFIVFNVLLPEALPALVGGATITTVAMIGASAMAGAVGAGGLGDLAIRYGYERYETTVMIYVILILIALVSTVQFTGDTIVRRLKRRR